MVKERIARHFQDHRESIKRYIADLTCRLIRQKTVNFPPGMAEQFPYMEQPGCESRVAKIVQEELVRHRVDCKVLEKTKGRANVLATVGKGRKRLMLVCHTDVVPPGEGWKGDAFEPTVREGFIVGRGSLDNKGPLAAGIVAAQVLKSYEKHLKGQYLLLGVADGERHGANGKKEPCGLDWVLADGLPKVDFAIVPEVGREMRQIAVAEKGRMTLRVTTSNRPVRQSAGEWPENPIVRMSRLIERLSTFRFSHPPHAILGPATVEVLRLGGETRGRLGGACQATFDVRYVPGMTRPAMLAELTLLAGQIGQPFNFALEADVPPAEIDPENLLVRSIQHNIGQEMGLEPPLVGVSRITLARHLMQQGVVTVGFGPGTQAAFHAVNEYVEVDQLFTFARVLAFVVIDLLT